MLISSSKRERNGIFTIVKSGYYKIIPFFIAMKIAHYELI